MRSLRAGIYKDIRLFLTASGIISLILPVLVAFALTLGLNDTQNVDLSLRPFEIAVYDRDDTLMSKTLVNQLRGVDLISNVRYYTSKSFEDSASHIDWSGNIKVDNTLFSSDLFVDCAVVLVLPQDFFYDAYTGEEDSVRVILNGDMPLESSLASSMAASVSGILKSERAAWYAAYSVKNGGEFDQADFESFCESSASTILDNALGRLDVIETVGISSEIASNVRNSFFACAASMLMHFVSVGVLKTLPDEGKLGLYDRFFSLGGSLFQLLISKYITAAFFCAIGVAPLFLILKPGMQGGALVLPAAFTACFTMMLALTKLTRRTESFMLIGGIVTALSLLFGGVIYPSKLFPQFAKYVSQLTVPKYLLAGLERAEIRASVLPLGIISAVCIIVFLVFEAVSKKAISRRWGGAV